MFKDLLLIVVIERATTAPTPTLSIMGKTLIIPCSLDLMTKLNLDFLQVPSPSQLIVTLRERHTYYCNHSQTNGIFWQLNGSKLLSFSDLFPFPGVSISTENFPDGGVVSALTIGGRPEHNNTAVGCIAELDDTSRLVTPGVMFIIQG